MMIADDWGAVLETAVRAHLREGRLPCAKVFAIAEEFSYPPAQVALYADKLGIRIGWCQLGLFGTAKRPKPLPVKGVLPEIRARIEASLEEDQLPCIRAWEIAAQLGLDRLAVGKAADGLGIPISRCQLGCFP
jgi:hypothetical protein